MPHEASRTSTTNLAAAVAWGIGASLCVVQFASRRSLWVDELAIVRNVMSRDLAALLTRPLDNDQVAPQGFLLVQDALARLPVAAEVTMRLYALVVTLVTLALVVRLARTQLEGWVALVPPLVFGLSAQTMWLSAQAKPYASDACLATALMLAALTVPRWRLRPRFAAGVAALAVAAPWFSLTAVFVLPSLVVALAADDRRERTLRVSSATVTFALMAAASAIAAVAISRWHIAPSTMRFMQEFWRQTFPVDSPSKWIDLRWSLYTLRQLVWNLTNGVASYAYSLLVLVGAWALFRRSPLRALLVLLPFALALGAAMLKLYPLAGRLGFFLLPLLALLIGMATDQVARWLRDRRAPILVASGVVAPPALWLVLHAPPFAIEHTRPLLDVLRQEARAGDVVYVPYGSWQAWSYYAPRVGLSWLPAKVGSCHGSDMRGYVDEVRSLATYRRTWILFVPTGRLQNPRFLTTLADREGRRLRTFRVATRDATAREREVLLYLYDFGGSAIAPDSASVWRRTAAIPRSADDCHGAAVPTYHVERAGEVSDAQ